MEDIPLVIQCHCGKKIRVSEGSVGKKARCPACNSVFVVANATTAASPTVASVATADGTAKTAAAPSVVQCTCGTRFRRPGKSTERFKCPGCGFKYENISTTNVGEAVAVANAPASALPPLATPVSKNTYSAPQASLVKHVEPIPLHNVQAPNWQHRGTKTSNSSGTLLWVGIAGAAVLMLGVLGGAAWFVLPMLKMESVAVNTPPVGDASIRPTDSIASSSGEGAAPNDTALSGANFSPSSSMKYSTEATLVKDAADCFAAIGTKLSLVPTGGFTESAEQDLRRLKERLSELDELWDAQTMSSLASGLTKTDRQRLENSLGGVRTLRTSQQLSPLAAEVSALANDKGDKWLAKIDSAFNSASTNPTAGIVQKEGGSSESNRLPLGSATDVVATTNWALKPDKPATEFDPSPASNFRIELPDVMLAGQSLKGGLALERRGIQLVFAWPHRPIVLVYLGESANGKATVYDLKSGTSIKEFVGFGTLGLQGGALNATGEYLAYQIPFEFGLLRSGSRKPVYSEKTPDNHWFFFSGDSYFSGFGMSRRFSLPLTGNSKDAVVDVGSTMGQLSSDEQSYSLSPTGRYITVLPRTKREDFVILDTQSWKKVGLVASGDRFSIKGSGFSNNGEFLFIHSGGATNVLSKIRIADGTVIFTKEFSPAEWSSFKVSSVKAKGPWLESFPGDQHIILGGAAIFDANSFQHSTTLKGALPGFGNRPISSTQVLSLEGDSLVPNAIF